MVINNKMCYVVIICIMSARLRQLCFNILSTKMPVIRGGKNAPYSVYLTKIKRKAKKKISTRHYKIDSNGIRRYVMINKIDNNGRRRYTSSITKWDVSI